MHFHWPRRAQTGGASPPCISWLGRFSGVTSEVDTYVARQIQGLRKENQDAHPLPPCGFLTPPPFLGLGECFFSHMRVSTSSSRDAISDEQTREVEHRHASGGVPTSWSW